MYHRKSLKFDVQNSHISHTSDYKREYAVLDGCVVVYEAMYIARLLK